MFGKILFKKEGAPAHCYINMTKIIQYPDQVNLAQMCLRIKNKSIILDSKYQKDYIWTQKDASKLIQSFLLGIPVPQIFLHWNTVDTDKHNARTVIDGRQRLISIYRFIEDKKWEGKDFKLILDDNNLGKKWHNKTFDELPNKYQDKLYDATINIVNLRCSDDMLFTIYERLHIKK